MFFSVIIPTHNRKEFLKRAITSVLKQKIVSNSKEGSVSSDVKFEIIVVDDGSTDDSCELINYEALNINYIYSKENRGVSWARNKGISLARGEWICFLDSDDEWINKKLQLTYDYCLKNPLLKIIHGNEIWIRNGVRVNQMKKHQKYGGYIFSKCLPLCLISPSAVAIHKDVFNEVGLFREDFIVCEDYELWLRITYKMEIGFIERPIIIKHGGHEDQLSRRYVAMDYYRVLAMFDFFNRNMSNVSSMSHECCERSLQQLVLNEMITKSEILLNGYKRHNNFSDFKKIEEIYNFAKSTLALINFGINRE